MLSLIDSFSLQFAPTYHEYVLYSNEGEDELTKYSPGSIVPSGQDIQLVEISVVDAKVPVSSSLLSHDTNLAEGGPEPPPPDQHNLDREGLVGRPAKDG